MTDEPIRTHDDGTVVERTRRPYQGWALDDLPPGPLPPSQPPGWMDPDPLHVEPRVPEPWVPATQRRRRGCGIPTVVLAIVAAAVLLAVAVLLASGAFATAARPATSEVSRSPETGSGSSATSLVPGAPLMAASLAVTGGGAPTSPTVAPVPSPSGEITFVVSASATWCAPTARQCQSWGGNAKLAAVNSFRDGDEPYLVRVSQGSRSVVVLVVSYCACLGTEHAIDLSPAAFKVLAPLSRGRIDVVLEWPVPELLRTDADLRMQREVRGDELYRAEQTP